MKVGSIQRVGGLNTAGSFGVPVIVAEVSLSAQSAAIATANLLASAPAGLYRVTYYYGLTRAATTSSATQLTLGWNDGTAQTTTGTNINGNTLVGGFNTASFSIYLPSAANITYAQSYSSSGATTMQYQLRIVLERIG